MKNSCSKERRLLNFEATHRVDSYMFSYIIPTTLLNELSVSKFHVCSFSEIWEREKYYILMLCDFHHQRKHIFTRKVLGVPSYKVLNNL